MDFVTADERRRLDAVRRYDILDTPPDGAFDRVTALAARFCGVPISTITIVDEDRIWFKSARGIAVDEIPRDPGLCASAVMEPEPYVVTDAAIDPRTLNNPLVRGELGLRFYAAVPLRTSDGHGLGTLNVIDVEPRTISDEELETLADLAAIVMDELELRLAARRAVELEAEREKARYRDRIVAAFSHDMRTPLAVLQGFATLAAQDEPDDEVPRLMRQQLRRLDWLIRQFLDYASVEAGQPPAIDLTTVPLGQVVMDAVEVVADRGDVEVEVADDVPPALGDRDRTWQIVAELLNNAARFTAPGDAIRVTVAPGAGDTVEVTVADHGPGLAPADRERVFERAFRDQERGGAGLGLYLSRLFAEAQGGRLEVESAPGDGSRFTLVLPAAVA